jgi:predicted Zn finger-like uncharacterized protein
MLIVCPSCASEYMIDPGRLGAEGRIVRCATCKDTWFVTPEAEESQATADDDDSPEVAVEEAPEPALDNDEAGDWKEFASAPSEPARDPEYPASKAEDGLRAASQAAARGSGGSSRRFAAGPLLVLVILVIAGSALWGRTHVVRTFPATAAVYASIGLPVNLRGLEFRAVRSELVADGTDTFLLVEGEIANISGRDASVPPIEIGVRGAEGQMLYTWTNDPPRQTLATSGAAPFRARLAAPPAEGRQVLVRFAPGRDGAAVASHTP